MQPKSYVPLRTFVNDKQPYFEGCGSLQMRQPRDILVAAASASTHSATWCMQFVGLQSSAAASKACVVAGNDSTQMCQQAMQVIQEDQEAQASRVCRQHSLPLSSWLQVLDSLAGCSNAAVSTVSCLHAPAQHHPICSWLVYACGLPTVRCKGISQFAMQCSQARRLDAVVAAGMCLVQEYHLFGCTDTATADSMPCIPLNANWTNPCHAGSAPKCPARAQSVVVACPVKPTHLPTT